MDNRPARSVLGTALLFALAMAYLRLGLFIPMEFSDEGMIVYGIWRVSEGELPYRDFHQLYAPSTFFLGGALFRLFGTDLMVLRYLVLIVKAAICVLVYFSARRLSGRSESIFVYAVSVVLLGVGWPIVTTPYPNFFATALCLAGVLLVLGLGRRVLLGSALAGLCFGLAVTFKQTTGAFAFLAIALSLLRDERPAGKSPGAALLAVARASRWFVLLFAASLIVFYLSPRNPWWNLALLSSPALALIAWLAAREYRAPPGPAYAWGGFERLVAMTAAFLLPLVGYGGVYASLGLGNEILHDVFLGLPALTNWMVPFSQPDLTFFLWQVAIGSAVASVLYGRRSDAPRAVLGARIALVVSMLAVAAIIVEAWPARPRHLWFWMSSDLLRSLPFWIVWLSIFGMLRERAKEPGTASAPNRALFVLTLYAAMALLWLYPAADIWHIFGILPSCLPLLAHHLRSLWRVPEERVHRPLVERFAPWAISGVLGAALVLPALLDLMSTVRAKRAVAASMPRASGMTGAPGFHGRDAEVVRYLREAQRREEAVFVLSGKPLFYFLADRVSPVQELEFVLYSVANDVIGAGEGRAFVDDRLVGQLQQTRPLIIDDRWDDRARKVRQAYPQLDRLLRRHYRVERTFGPLRVLRWYAPSEEEQALFRGGTPGTDQAAFEEAESRGMGRWTG